MAEKASLMLEAAKKNEEIQKLEAEIARCNEQIESIPQTLEQDKQAAREKSLAAFRSRQDELISRVRATLKKKRKEIEEYIDSLPGLEAKEFAGKMEVKDIEAQLKAVYPDALIDRYMCSNVQEIEDPEEAFEVYAEAERGVANLNGGNGMVSKLFNGITGLLVGLTTNPNLGLKALPAVVLFYIAGVIFFPFVFITAFSLIGVASAVQGLQAKRVIQKLYAVKLFLRESYNEDVFAEDKNDILGKIDALYVEIEKDYIDEIKKSEYKYDERQDTVLEKKANGAVKRAKQDRDVYNSQLQKAKDDLVSLHERIGQLEEEERKRAENARKEILETITWKREWLQHIFIDVTKENKRVLLPFSKANSCYFAKDAEDLKAFSRITVLQCLLHMHPEFASEVVLDYKYLGGQLTQFQSLEGKAIGLFTTDAEINKKVENIDNEIKSRTKNILASSPDLDSFNKLMSSYGSTGEFYVVVHVFGLANLNNTWKNWLRNGNRVGYIFKLYWTVEELEALKDEIPFADLKDFFEITNTAIPRSATSVKRIVGIDS